MYVQEYHWLYVYMYIYIMNTIEYLSISYLHVGLLLHHLEIRHAPHIRVYIYFTEKELEPNKNLIRS